jgi:hypothetical protein
VVLGREGTGVWPTQKLSRGAPYGRVANDLLHSLSQINVFYNAYVRSTSPVIPMG